MIHDAATLLVNTPTAVGSFETQSKWLLPPVLVQDGVIFFCVFRHELLLYCALDVVLCFSFFFVVRFCFPISFQRFFPFCFFFVFLSLNRLVFFLSLPQISGVLACIFFSPACLLRLALHGQSTLLLYFLQ